MNATKATKATKATTTTKAAAQPSTRSLQAAKAAAKAITTAALAKAAQPKAAQPKAAAAAAVAPATQRFNYAQLVIANPKAPVHKGFFGVVAALAKKPIAIGALAAQVQAQVKFTSAKNPAFVARVRTRHALTRLGVLVAAPAKR